MNRIFCECEAPVPDGATPMNTIGMGNVEPLGTDPIPTKKRKMKSLKDFIRNKVKKHVKEKDFFLGGGREYQ